LPSSAGVGFKSLVIERYLTKEILHNLLAVLAVILLIFMGRYFARYLGWAAEGFISGSIVFDLLVLRTLSAMNLIIPFGLYIAIFLAFGRLYKDSEMTALSASGIGPQRILRSMFWLTLSVSAVVAVLSLLVSPWSFEKALQIQERAEASGRLEGVLAGHFNRVNAKRKAVIYVEGVSEDRKRISNVFVQMSDGNTLDIYSAKSAFYDRSDTTGERYIVLSEGHRYVGIPGEADFRIQSYEKSAFRVEPPKIVEKNRTQRALSSTELMRSTDVKDRAEFYWRLSLPLSTFLLAMLAMLLSKTSPRRGRFAKLFLAILVLVIYNNMVTVSRSWVERGVLPPELGMWYVHIIAFTAIVFFLYRQIGFSWMRQRKQILRTS